MGRPRQHNEKTRETLLAAAEKLVAERGTAAVTVRSVASRAGTTTRAVYALFGSKDALALALAERAFGLLSDRINSLPVTADPVEDLVAAAVLGFRAFVLEHPDLFRLVFVVGVGVRFGAQTAAAQAAALGHLIQRVERAQAAGWLDHHGTEQVVLMVDALCTGLANREICGAIDASRPEEIWSDALRALLTGLRARQVPSTDPTGQQWPESN